MVDDDFEKITLSNVWIKEHILDLIKKISDYERAAVDGTYHFQDIITMTEEQRPRIMLEAYKRMRTETQILLGNVTPYISKKVVGILNIQLKTVSDIKDNKLIDIKKNEVSHTLRLNVLTKDYFSHLDALREIKTTLLNEISERELLIPKKSTKVDEVVKADEEEDLKVNEDD